MTVTAEPAFGEAVEIAERTLLVGGRPMDFQKLQADVAAVLLHRAGDTLYIIDTGATEDFRQPLREAIDRLAPFKRVVLVNSHGHPDHVGNNSLIDELGVREPEHYIAQADLALMADDEGYFERAFGGASRYLPLPFPAEAMAQGMNAMFGELETRIDRVVPLESRPLESLGTGAAAWPGWRFGRDLWILRAGGHTAGQVIAYLPREKVLYTADEAMGFYPVFPDSDPAKAFETLTRCRGLVERGEVAAFANGHQFQALDAEGAAKHLDGLIESYFAFDEAVHEALANGGATLFEVRDAVGKMYEKHGLHGEAENKLFGGMQLLKKFEELGARPTGDDPQKARFVLPGPGFESSGNGSG